MKNQRTEEAKNIVRELLDDIEIKNTPIDLVLLKTKRLARLMRDTDAQKWIDLETKGYPSDFSFDEIGTCKKYAYAGGRLTTEGKYYPISLPKLEATAKSDEILFNNGKIPTSTTKVKDFLEQRATETLLANQLKVQKAHKEIYVNNHGLFVSIKSSIHNYVTESYLALELGDVAQDIFEKSREQVDNFVRAHCPKGAEQLVAITERMNDNSNESRSAALTSCRRLLMTVADAIFPPQKDKFIDSKGKERKVGQEEYKNRILAFIDLNLSGKSTSSILTSELNHIAARLDAIYEKSCKGVHDDVTLEEAQLSVIQTYIFIAEIAQMKKN